MIKLENGALRVCVSPVGGSLMSLYGKESGIEYLWQGDPAYWKGRAPNLFPFVGRLYGETYTLHGVPYHMGIHGFAAKKRMETEEAREDRCVLLLREDEETLGMYPFRFEYRIRCTLDDNRLLIGYEVINRSEETMYFGVGGHPGFNVPLTAGIPFEEYRLTLSEASVPRIVRFSDRVLVTGERERYPLADLVHLPLRHDLFDRDAVVLSDMPRCVTLSAPGDEHRVRVSFPQMPYVGFWHRPHSDAPYVCIEPWSVLPGREGIVEEISNRKDMTALAPNGKYVNNWSIEVW